MTGADNQGAPGGEPQCIRKRRCTVRCRSRELLPGRPACAVRALDLSSLNAVHLSMLAAGAQPPTRSRILALITEHGTRNGASRHCISSVCATGSYCQATVKPLFEPCPAFPASGSPACAAFSTRHPNCSCVTWLKICLSHGATSHLHGRIAADSARSDSSAPNCIPRCSLVVCASGESDTSARGRIWRRRNRRGKLELRLLPGCCPHTIFEALRRCNLAAPGSVSARIQN